MASLRTLWLLPLILAGCGSDPVRVPPPPAGSGALSVSWVLAGPDGAELSCSNLGFSGFAVRIGGEPTEVPCGESQSLEYSGLPPGRYPLVIVPEVFSGTSVDDYTYRANVEIEDQKTTVHQASITVDPNLLNAGTMALRWRIDGRMASVACGALGAETFRLVADDTSIAPFMLDLPCGQGTAILEMRRKGTYQLVGSLRDADHQIVRNQVRTALVVVLPGQTSSVDFNFTESTTISGSLIASWTVTSSPAAEACPLIGGRLVEVTVLGGELSNPVAVQTASIACASGSARFDQLPIADDYRVRFSLFDSFDTIVADAFLSAVSIFDTQTTTVAVDLTPN